MDWNGLPYSSWMKVKSRMTLHMLLVSLQQQFWYHTCSNYLNSSIEIVSLLFSCIHALSILYSSTDRQFALMLELLMKLLFPRGTSKGTIFIKHFEVAKYLQVSNWGIQCTLYQVATMYPFLRQLNGLLNVGILITAH